MEAPWHGEQISYQPQSCILKSKRTSWTWKSHFWPIFRLKWPPRRPFWKIWRNRIHVSSLFFRKERNGTKIGAILQLFFSALFQNGRRGHVFFPTAPTNNRGLVWMKCNGYAKICGNRRKFTPVIALTLRTPSKPGWRPSWIPKWPPKIFWTKLYVSRGVLVFSSKSDKNPRSYRPLLFGGKKKKKKNLSIT